MADQNEHVLTDQFDLDCNPPRRTARPLDAYYDELDSRVRAVEREIDAIERCLDTLDPPYVDAQAHGLPVQVSNGAHRAVDQAASIMSRMTTQLSQLRNIVTRP